MDAAKRSSFRMLIVAATAAGAGLVSSAVAIADESDPIDVAPSTQVSGPLIDERAEENPLVIELVVEDRPAAEAPSGPDVVPGGTDPREVSGEEVQPDDDQAPAIEPTSPVHTIESDTALTVVAPISEGVALDNGTGDDHTGGTGDDHTGGGMGDPYRMTFVVTWRFPDGAVIPVLDDTLPTDWRTIFDLTAASSTGGGKPTAAHCTYPEGSSDLVCEFVNPGHASGPDGMVVPGKPTATYTVTVLWPTSGWTIDGANDGPHSARNLCPRGGDHGDDHGAAALEDEGATCVHTVVMRENELASEPPASDPPDAVPPASEAPAPPTAVPVDPPTAQAAAAQISRPTAGTLPATGNSTTTPLVAGALMLALGGCLSVLTRRRADPTLD